jgi:hypothetical protein
MNKLVEGGPLRNASTNAQKLCEDCLHATVTHGLADERRGRWCAVCAESHPGAVGGMVDAPVVPARTMKALSELVKQAQSAPDSKKRQAAVSTAVQERTCNACGKLYVSKKAMAGHSGKCSAYLKQRRHEVKKGSTRCVALENLHHSISRGSVVYSCAAVILSDKSGWP